MTDNDEKMPIWVKLLIIVLALPILAYLWLISNAPRDRYLEILLWAYPIYIIISAICEWLCWFNRRELFWILIIISFLTHAAMFYLIVA